MGEYLYFTINENDKHYFYKLEDAKKYYLENGGKLYAYTKDLFPKRYLLAW